MDLEIFIENLSSLLPFHLAIGLFFALLALTINHLLPYSFSKKPKDGLFRKIVFYALIVVVLILSFVGDVFYLFDSIVEAESLSQAKAKHLLEDLNDTKIISALFSLIVYVLSYFLIALLLKNYYSLFKCFSVFKFK
jgi:hypothetical protein